MYAKDTGSIRELSLAELDEVSGGLVIVDQVIAAVRLINDVIDFGIAMLGPQCRGWANVCDS